MINKYFVMGSLFWGGVITFILFTLRSRSCFHSVISDLTGKQKRIGIFLVIAIVIAVCIFPMGLSPHYNGTISNWRNLYEVMTESILEGHLYIDYGDMDPKLLDMDNPYDPVMRRELGVNFHWDHALYQGHYYMYYGIVPVFLVFLPYRLLTGTSLTTYHATQLFVALFMIGVFTLFYFLAKRFFTRLTWGTYLFLSAAVAVMSVWYSVAAPTLYCTAITSGLCLEIWSIYFFTKAVWGGLEDGKSILCAFAGSILGALAFGCRPSVALANILVIPMLAEYLRQKKITPVLIRRLVFAASPYVVVAVLLMAYNYVRFDNPFEFGQTWQLTSADQSSYGDIGSRLDLINIGNGVLQNFISFVPLKEDFPYLSFNGVLINFPILLFPLVGLTREETRKKLREIHLYNFVAVLCFTPVLITIITVMESPWLLERYRMDLYWLMGILCYIVTGVCYENIPEGAGVRFTRRMMLWSLVTVLTCGLLYLVPWDANLTAYDPEILDEVYKVLTLGLQK